MLFKGPKSLTETIKKMLEEAKNPEFVVPEGIEKEGVAHFMGAAAAAHRSGQKKFNFGGKVYPVKIKPHIAKQVNEEGLVESHFKVGDEVVCKKSGMEGEVVKIDSPQVGKYYTVKQENGKMVKYAPDELKKEEDEKEDMKEAAGASKGAEEKFHTKLDKLVHKTFGHSPAEKKKEKMKEEAGLEEELTNAQKDAHFTLMNKHRLAAKTAKGADKDKHRMAAYDHQHALQNPWYKKSHTDSMAASKRLGVTEEVEEIDEMGPGKLPRIDKKVENEYGDKLMKDFLARGGQVKQVSSPKLPKNRNRFVAKGSLSSGERTLTRSGGKSFTSRMGEEVEIEEERDTPGNGKEHQCALHVKSEQFGEGKTIFSQHAEPDDNGDIAWYDVMFEHGIEKHVPTDQLEILVSEAHTNHKKKMQEEIDLEEGRGRPRKHPPKPTASDEDDYGPDIGPEPDQNIVQHLKKAVDTKGNHDVKFADGSSHKVPHQVAHTVLTAMGKLKPADRLEVQKHVHASHKNLMDVHRMIK